MTCIATSLYIHWQTTVGNDHLARIKSDSSEDVVSNRSRSKPSCSPDRLQFSNRGIHDFLVKRMTDPENAIRPSYVSACSDHIWCRDSKASHGEANIVATMHWCVSSGSTRFVLFQCSCSHHQTWETHHLFKVTRKSMYSKKMNPSTLKT